VNHYLKRWQYLEIACRPQVWRRAIKTALLVGTLLMLINQGDLLMRMQLDRKTVLKIILTYLVPYLVSTTSSVAAIVEHERLTD